MTAAQWAADPYQRAQLRYWDGQKWTGHVSTNGVTSDEGATGGHPPASFGEQPVAHQQFGQRPAESSPFGSPTAQQPVAEQQPFAQPISTQPFPGAYPQTPQPFPSAQFGGQPGVGQQPYGYQPYGATPAPTKSADGRLMAAGVMTIIQGSIAAIFGLWFFSLSQSDGGEIVDDLSGGAITAVALIVLALAAALLAAGIGSVRGRTWGRITTIVLEAIFVALTLLGLSGSGDAGGAIVPLVYCGIVLGLAASSKSR